MREIVGNLWDYYREGFILCITTNGSLKKNGEAVMGRGCAAQAKHRFSGLPGLLGERIRRWGNILGSIGETRLTAFPTKNRWQDKSEIALIFQSAIALARLARHFPTTTYVLPRPGCGNGGLDWETQVKPVIQNLLPDNVWIISKEKR